MISPSKGAVAHLRSVVVAVAVAVATTSPGPRIYHCTFASSGQVVSDDASARERPLRLGPPSSVAAAAAPRAPPDFSLSSTDHIPLSGDLARMFPSSHSSSLAPYTGGDGPLSGDLARMFPSPHSSPHLRPPPPPPAASSPRLPQSGLVVGPPRPSPPPSPEPSTRNPPAGPQKSEFASGIPIWCCFLAAAAVAAGIGIGVFVLVSARRLEVLAAASAVAAAVGVVGVWNWWSRAREAEGFFRRFPDSSVGRGSLPVGELVKISG
ncbi:allergen Asp f 7 homolog, partial [Ananas comosus]|uniref:Allergen Asp f 7 homolog n=1 Tax=Ananas comosus TaxID=4615 RepID=A0A6P5EBH8_ANACO